MSESWPTSRVQDLVSVVIPFAKPNENFLREAVASVVSQTHDNWEIVLADDGDDQRDGDMARAIIAPIRDRARVVTYAERGNRGISAARNEGIRHARGEFVTFLDADDIYLPRRLELAVRTLRENPAANLVCTNTRYWYSWDDGNQASDFVPDLGETGVFTPPRLLGRWLKGKSAVPTTCGFAVRRETIEAVRGFENGFGGLYEDQVFLAKICLTNVVVIVDEVSACYRQHRDSMCARVTTEQARSGRQKFLRWLDGYVTTMDVTSPEVHTIIRNEMWKVTHPRMAKVRRMVGKAFNQRTGARVR